MPEEPLVTTAEAARRLGVGARTLAHWAQTSIVRPAMVTAGGHYRWDVTDLRQQLDGIQRRRDF